MSRRLVRLLAVVLTLSVRVHAQPLSLPEPYSVHDLAAGVFAVIRETPFCGASDANVLVIVNDADVIVVDAGIFPASARQVIAEIRKRTAKPVRYVITTHWHSDHHYGNQEYRKQWPQVEFISHPVTRANILQRDVPDFRRNQDSIYPAQVRALEKTLRTGALSNGTPLDSAARREFTESLALYRFFLRDTRGLRHEAATITVDRELTLHRGKREIVLRWLGRGNTAGDLVVHLPNEGILATGDLVVSPIPFGFESYAFEWPTTLRALAQLNATTIVPGHGYLMKDMGYAELVATMLDSLGAGVRRGVAEGLSLDSIRARLPLAQLRARFTNGDRTLERGLDGLFVQPIVEAAWNELHTGDPSKAPADSARR